LDIFYSGLRNVFNSSDFFAWDAVARQDVIVHIYQSALPLLSLSFPYGCGEYLEKNKSRGSTIILPIKRT